MGEIGGELSNSRAGLEVLDGVPSQLALSSAAGLLVCVLFPIAKNSFVNAPGGFTPVCSGAGPLPNAVCSEAASVPEKNSCVNDPGLGKPGSGKSAADEGAFPFTGGVAVPKSVAKPVEKFVGVSG